MTYHERNAGHGSHKQRVERALLARGFTVEASGWEELQPAQQSQALKEYPGAALRRWWPDLHARRGPFGEMWVDAKTELDEESPNHAVELAALACYGIIETRLRRAVVLVWRDGTCNYSVDLMPVHVETRGDMLAKARQNGGSGTAFVLVRKADQRQFADVFGALEQAA